jgi:predicted transcriptional regulator
MLEITTPTPLQKSYDWVAEMAESVAHKLSFEPGGDLGEVVKKLGGRIVHVDLVGNGSSDSGSIEINGEEFEIRLAIATGPLRDRFTIAHEIGHFVLHYLYPNKYKDAGIQRMVAQRYGNDQVEREANWFAAAFLMPTEQFKKDHEELGGDQFALSSKYQVSRAAVDVRAKVLGLIH